MAQNSWPFVGGGGTAVNEDQWSIMARAFRADGVIGGYADELEVYGDSSGRQVKVKTGRASVRGHWYESTAEETIAIAANSSGNPRIDRVALRLDPSANSIVLAVVQGTPAGSPSAPSLTQTDVGVHEISLAQVAVANGASTIAAGNVTDERVADGEAWVTVASLGSGWAQPAADAEKLKYWREGNVVRLKGQLTSVPPYVSPPVESVLASAGALPAPGAKRYFPCITVGAGNLNTYAAVDTDGSLEVYFPGSGAPISPTPYLDGCYYSI